MARTGNERARQARARTQGCVLLLAALVLGNPMTAASAHDSVGARGGRLFSSPTICVDGAVVQNHGYHWMQTTALGGGRTCDWGPVRTWHTQYQEYYKTAVWGQPGTYCGFRGWNQSPDGGHVDYVLVNNWDIWHMPCNNGAGVNVWISIDSWQYSWWNNTWNGGAWRPATAHCHCP